MQVTTIGFDLARNVFQVHSVAMDGAAVIRKRLRRARVLEFFVDLAPCLVGMEACPRRVRHHRCARYRARRLLDREDLRTVKRLRGCRGWPRSAAGVVGGAFPGSRSTHQDSRKKSKTCGSTATRVEFRAATPVDQRRVSSLRKRRSLWPLRVLPIVSQANNQEEGRNKYKLESIRGQKLGYVHRPFPWRREP